MRELDGLNGPRPLSARDPSTGAITGVPLAVLPTYDIKTNVSFDDTLNTAQYDFGLIHVPGNVLASYGSFAIDNNYPGGTVNITGYPGLPVGPPPGKNVNTQFNDIGTVTAGNGVLTGSAMYWEGESGGPVWYYDGSTARAVGIVSFIQGTVNTAVQLTKNDNDQIQGWQNSLTRWRRVMFPEPRCLSTPTETASSIRANPLQQPIAVVVFH